MPKGCTNIIQWHPRSRNGHLPRVWTRLFRTCPQILTVKLLTIWSMNFMMSSTQFFTSELLYIRRISYTLFPCLISFLSHWHYQISSNFTPKKTSQKFPVPLPLYGKKTLDHRRRQNWPLQSDVPLLPLGQPFGITRWTVVASMLVCGPWLGGCGLLEKIEKSNQQIMV